MRFILKDYESRSPHNVFYIICFLYLGMDEIWKDIPGANGYQVSDFGRIRSIDREVAPGRGRKTNRKRSGKILHGGFDKNGYHQITLGFYHPKGVSRKFHRIVMLAFVGESKLDVNHKDGDKKNNRLDNLEYVTKSQNHIHARKVLNKLVGENHWNHRFSNDEVQEMKRKYKSREVRVKNIRKEFGCSVGHFYKLIK